MNTTKSERKRIRNRKKRDSGRIGGVRPMRRLSALTAARTRTNEDSTDPLCRSAETLCARIADDERAAFEEGSNENDLKQQQNELEQQIVKQHVAEQAIVHEQHMIGQFQCITSSELSDFDRTPLINDGSNEVNILYTQLIMAINELD